MSKRLRDSKMLEDVWYRELKPEYKLLWTTLLDVCDFSGVWKVDTKHLDYLLQWTYTWPEVLSYFQGRIIEIDNGKKWMIVKFIAFQYGSLNPGNKVHASVIKCLTSHGLDPSPFLKVRCPEVHSPQQAKGVPTVDPTVKEKEKEKEKDSISSPLPEPDPSWINQPDPNAGRPIGTKMAPVEWKPRIKAAGGKMFGKDDEASWQGPINKYGIDLIEKTMETMPPLEAADPIKVRNKIWLTQKREKEMRRVDESNEQTQSKEAEEREVVETAKARNREACIKMARIKEYIETPEGESLYVRLLAHPFGQASIDALPKKVNALAVDSILRAIPELLEIIKPQKESA